jgi:hypothetical protein
VADMRTVRPVTKSIAFTNQGTIAAGIWHYYRVEIPTNVPGWRVQLICSNSIYPDLYLQRAQSPTLTSFFKRSQSQTNDIIALTSGEATPGAYIIGVYQPLGTSSYTLSGELIYLTTLAWDPGTTHLGAQVYTNQATNTVDAYFKITTQNTALAAWRTALNVITGEAAIYLAKGYLPSMGSNLFKSELAGSDGFVVGGSSFNAGEDWYYMVRATPGSQWTLVTGEPFMADLGTLTSPSAPKACGISKPRFRRARWPGVSG